MLPTPYNGFSFAGMRIGLLGGSFNPAHDGHVAISLFALKRLQLDQVWWLVSPQNPLKTSNGMAPFAERLRVAEAAVAKHPNLRATDLEAHLGTRYTVDTLRALRRRMPRARFVWLMGADNLEQIHQWQGWQDIFAEVPIAVFRRPGYAAGLNRGKAAQVFARRAVPLENAGQLALCLPPAWLVLDNPYNGLSATLLRQSQSINDTDEKERDSWQQRKKPRQKSLKPKSLRLKKQR